MLMDTDLLSAAPQSKLLSSIVFLMTSFEKIQEFYYAFFPPDNDDNGDDGEDTLNENNNGEIDEYDDKSSSNYSEINDDDDDDTFIDELREAFNTEPTDVKQLIMEYGKIVMIVCAFVIIRQTISKYFQKPVKKIKSK